MTLRLAVLGVIVGTTSLDQGIAMDDPAVNQFKWRLITEIPGKEVLIPHNSVIDKTMLQGQTVVFVKPTIIYLQDDSKKVTFQLSLPNTFLKEYLVDLEILNSAQLKLKFTATHYCRNDFLPLVLTSQGEGNISKYPDYPTGKRDLSELEKNTTQRGMSSHARLNATDLFITHGAFKAMPVGSSETESGGKNKIFFEKTKTGDINFRADFVIAINK